MHLDNILKNNAPTTIHHAHLMMHCPETSRNKQKLNWIAVTFFFDAFFMLAVLDIGSEIWSTGDA
jgi:hypothetical protein